MKFICNTKTSSKERPNFTLLSYFNKTHNLNLLLIAKNHLLRYHSNYNLTSNLVTNDSSNQLNYNLNHQNTVNNHPNQQSHSTKSFNFYRTKFNVQFLIFIFYIILVVSYFQFMLIINNFVCVI